ncbi:NAD-P-binding protein [Trametes cingulata]|nr:NAD-P-binding protein [Trametes cingulata]
MSSKKLILVTGINGFLGSHTVDQLVKAGYRVRGTVRSSKVDFVRESNAIYGSDVEVIGIDDLAFGDFTDALKGVDAVIHVAAPLPGRDTPEDALTASIEGAVNILRQSERVGIKRYVLVSSIVTVGSLTDFSSPWKETDWFDTTREKALASNDPGFVYQSEKVLAEQAVWEFAEKHPSIDVTVLNPPIFIGPYAPNFRFTDALINQMSTNALLYQLVNPSGKFFLGHLLMSDIRDIARALMLTLKTPTHTKQKKRLLYQPYALSWKEVAEHVAQARPELKERISKAALTDYEHPCPPNPVAEATLRTVEYLGLGELVDWKESVLAGVDAVLEAEKKFAKEGKTFH